jgi:hypothetical protein
VLHSPKKAPYRFTFLLACELLVILCFPFTSGAGLQAHVFRLMAILLICAGLYTVLGRGRLTVVAFVLGVPPILIHLANILGYLHGWNIVAMALATVYLGFMSIVFVRAVVRAPTVTTDTLAGAISAYMLIGITYGLLYACIETIAPGSFRETVTPGRTIHPPELVFFSFVSLTTVGYGDIIPWAGPARSLAVLESITGVMYPAVLVARLIGLHSSARKHEE